MKSNKIKCCGLRMDGKFIYSTGTYTVYRYTCKVCGATREVKDYVQNKP